MWKSVTALSAALILGAALVGSATTASAKGRGYGGYGGSGGGYAGCCGPIPPKYISHTVYKHKHVKRYYDVWRHKKVIRIKKIVHVTKIQPILHVHKIKRVHTKIIGVVKPIHIKVTKVLPQKVHVTGRTVYLPPVCGCSSGGYGGSGGYGKY